MEAVTTEARIGWLEKWRDLLSAMDDADEEGSAGELRGCLSREQMRSSG
jgi:hypothetical protein